MPPHLMEINNRILLFVIVGVFIVVSWKLYTTALLTDNIRGFIYSSIHLAIVGVGSYWALRVRKK